MAPASSLLDARIQQVGRTYRAVTKPWSPQCRELRLIGEGKPWLGASSAIAS
jgi:hypothetical protein